MLMTDSMALFPAGIPAMEIMSAKKTESEEGLTIFIIRYNIVSRGRVN